MMSLQTLYNALDMILPFDNIQLKNNTILVHDSVAGQLAYVTVNGNTVTWGPRTQPHQITTDNPLEAAQHIHYSLRDS